MLTARRCAAVLAMGSAVLLACSPDVPQSDVTVTSGAPAAVRPSSAGDVNCPRTGQWQPCGLIDRVTKAGLSFKATGDSVSVPFFDVPGVRYRVAVTDTLLAFFFPDSAAVDRAVAQLDTVRMTPATDSLMPWPSVPSVIRSGNLLALYFAESARQTERLRLAITAGAPAPAP